MIQQVGRRRTCDNSCQHQTRWRIISLLLNTNCVLRWQLFAC